jgi:hypothetical protein
MGNLAPHKVHRKSKWIFVESELDCTNIQTPAHVRNYVFVSSYNLKFQIMLVKSMKYKYFPAHI